MARAVYGGRAPVSSGRVTAASNPNPSGISQGTPGGIGFAGIGVSAAGRRPGIKLTLGDEGYLWVLIAIELLAMGFLRRHFRRYHGG